MTSGGSSRVRNGSQQCTLAHCCACNARPAKKRIVRVTQADIRWFTRFRDDGTWETLNHYLVMRDRERAGREASPSAAIIDSQSVKTTKPVDPGL